MTFLELLKKGGCPDLTIWQGRTFKYAPKEITVSGDQHWASFDYYEGIAVAKELGLKQSTNISFDEFIVCCGDVVILVKPDELLEVERLVLS